MPCRLSSAAGPMPDSMSSCGELMEPPASTTSRLARTSVAAPSRPDQDAGGAPTVEQDPFGQRLRPDGQVSALAGRVQIGPGGAPADAALDRLVHPPEPLLAEAVDIFGGHVAGFAARVDEGLVERVVHRAVARMQRPVAAPVAVSALLPGLGPAEIRQHIPIGPAARAGRLPGLEIQGIAADINHAVDRGGPTQPLAARTGDTAVVRDAARAR